MSSLKSHISLILALISILLSIFLFRIFAKTLELYKQNIVNNYSIVIVSTKKIKKLNIPEINKIVPINIQKQIDLMKKKYKNIDFSKINFPYFYKLKLKKLPSPSELKSLTQILKSYPFIKRVLTHSSSQTKIYNLLMLINIITKTFMVITAVLGFLLIIKQLEVWKLLHSQRMYIMELFGAPFWFKGAALFKIAIFDGIISLFITMGIIFLLTNLTIFKAVVHDLNINLNIDYFQEFVILFVVSLLISLISSIIVVSTKK
jgi:cell division transport system permease protein